jgi:hypothetical protein
MASGHAGFAVLNRTGTPLVRLVLRSPLHPLLSGRLALITVTGRRTGRTYTIPVGYRREGATVTITVGAPERKRWWRNLTNPAQVRIRLRGTELSARGEARHTEEGGIEVIVDLAAPSGGGDGGRLSDE